jgi:hypothetical protein
MTTEVENISFENSRRIRERASKVFANITNATEKVCERENIEFYSSIWEEVLKKQYSELNKRIFDMAEMNGMSVYDICFTFMPCFSEPQMIHEGETFRIEQEIKLEPIPFELEKGPGYWKGKYYRLKKKLQELIDNKND